MFLKSVVDVARLYRTIKTHMDFIINDVFPKALAITPEERALWVEDPIQFVTQVYDTTTTAPTCAATRATSSCT